MGLLNIKNNDDVGQREERCETLDLLIIDLIKIDNSSIRGSDLLRYFFMDDVVNNTSLDDIFESQPTQTGPAPVCTMDEFMALIKTHSHYKKRIRDVLNSNILGYTISRRLNTQYIEEYQSLNDSILG